MTLFRALLRTLVGASALCVAAPAAATPATTPEAEEQNQAAPLVDPATKGIQWELTAVGGFAAPLALPSEVGTGPNVAIAGFVRPSYLCSAGVKAELTRLPWSLHIPGEPRARIDLISAEAVLRLHAAFTPLLVGHVQVAAGPLFPSATYTRSQCTTPRGLAAGGAVGLEARVARWVRLGPQIGYEMLVLPVTHMCTAMWDPLSREIPDNAAPGVTVRLAATFTTL